MTAPERYPPSSTIKQYMDGGVQGTISVAGNPPAEIVVDPAHGTLSIRVRTNGAAPDLSRYENLACTAEWQDGDSWLHLAAHLHGDPGEIYSLLCNVLDRLQLQGVGFGAAVQGALAALSSLLKERRRMSEDAQIGLIAELLVLQSIASEIGANEALSAWRGPLREEHDFGLSKLDIEVKCTRSELRNHWISGLSQLVPTFDRDLFILSVQLTSAGAGPGVTLPDVVGCLHAIPDMNLQKLDAALRSVAYYDEDANLYPHRWTLRSDPQFFCVDDSFPRLTRDMLTDAVQLGHRILDLTYKVDLENIPAALPPITLSIQTSIGEVL